jgi:hypothetical protein
MHYQQKCELTYETEKEVRHAMLEAEKGCPICEHFADRSRFVELPCKIGDTLYTVVRGYKIREWIVTNICFSDYLPRSVKVITARDKQNSEHMRFAEHYLEKTIFLTREAAEQALKGRENNG